MPIDIPLLARICEAPGAPGFEKEIRSLVLAELKGLADDVRVDNMGNVIALKKGKSAAKKTMAAAHMDEIATRLTGQLAYQPATQQWDTAFTADTTKSIFPPAQMKMMMQMMRGQLSNPSDAGALPLLNLFGQPPPPAPTPAK